MKPLNAVTVVGAGPVGLCAALLFVRQGLRVQLVGRRQSVVAHNSHLSNNAGQQQSVANQAPNQAHHQTHGQVQHQGPSSDARLFALTAASKALLQRLRVWDQLPTDCVQPVRAMHIYPPDQKPLPSSPRSACLVFDADDSGSLSWMVSHPDLMRALMAVVDTCTVDPADTSSIGIVWQESLDPTAVFTPAASLDKTQTNWIFAADGGDSRWREQAGLGYFRRDYFAHAVVMSFRLGRLNDTSPAGHGGVARQWFVDQSVLALLPMAGHGGEFVSMVWSRVDHDGLNHALNTRLNPALSDHLNHQQTQEDRASCATSAVMASLTKRGLLARIREDLGCDLLPVSEPMTYPLYHGIAPKWVQDKVVLLGDAAHQVHPLAGQGLNLGLEDVAALSELWTGKQGREVQGIDAWGIDALTEPRLQAWARRRRADSQPVLLACDALWQGFSSPNAHLRQLMSWGMLSVNRLPWLKRWLMTQAIRG